jgi:hypothetical protein
MTEIRTFLPTRLARLAWLVAGSILLSACAAGPQVRTAGAADVDFQAFRTFGFIDNLSTDRAGFHTLVSQQLVFSTRREMEVRGLKFVENPAEADLLINFYADLADRFRVRSTPTSWRGSSYWNHRSGMYRPWPGHRHWPTHSSVEVQQFTEGMLSIDVVDARRNLLVWEGLATKRLTQRTLNDLGPALDDAVHQVFRDFPVQPVL